MREIPKGESLAIQKRWIRVMVETLIGSRAEDRNHECVEAEFLKQVSALNTGDAHEFILLI